MKYFCSDVIHDEQKRSFICLLYLSVSTRGGLNWSILRAVFHSTAR